jgi:stage V sporulation protein K
LLEMGVIKSNGKKKQIFEEVSRSGLVAEYKGQTAPKVVAAVERAIGGVLFVDEAYALTRSGKDAFGHEAVDTLIKEIEDKRDRVIAIFAGYQEEMESFFDTNPGFKSRVPFKFYFDDYTCDELSKISTIFLSEKELTPPDTAQLWLNRTIRFTTGCCETTDCESGRDNGNGRTVRNILEATYRNFARRVVPQIYSSPELRPVLFRADLFTELKVSSKSAYAIKYGPNSAQKHLEAEFGLPALCADRDICQQKQDQDRDPQLVAVCSDSKYPPKTWQQLCTYATTRLTNIDGEDVALTAASMAIDAVLPTCHEDHINVDELEKLAQRAFLVIKQTEWDQLAQVIRAGGCQEMQSILSIVEDIPSLPDYDILKQMKQYPELAPSLSKLNGLIGLANVKDTMGKLFGLVKLSSWRSAFGLKSLAEQAFHMRFLGNPGTGKTVVARIVGEMLVKLGVISIPDDVKEELEADAKNRSKTDPDAGNPKETIIFKEVSRADLVASYVGQTAPMVEKAVKSARGGVLFIDEAYAIVRSGKGDGDSFGQEAVDTLIKEMEDKRKEVVVILAGYEDEMQTFFEANPGFKSRVPLTFRFEDYSCSELSSISSKMMLSSGVSISPNPEGSGLEKLIAFSSGCCTDVTASDCHSTRENGNGRTVRNLVEALFRSMATRVMQSKTPETSNFDFSTVLPSDVEKVVEYQADVRLASTCGPDGLLGHLSAALDKVDGLQEWFKQYKLSDPAGRVHTVMHEIGRMSKSLTGFQSSKIADLQQQCSDAVTTVVDALSKKAAKLCGRPDDRSGSDLAKLSAQISPSQSLTMEAFKDFMLDVETISTEAIMLRRLLADELPAQMSDLKTYDQLCFKSLKELLSKSVLMPLTEGLKSVKGQL